MTIFSPQIIRLTSPSSSSGALAATYQVFLRNGMAFRPSKMQVPAAVHRLLDLAAAIPGRDETHRTSGAALKSSKYSEAHGNAMPSMQIEKNRRRIGEGP